MRRDIAALCGARGAPPEGGGDGLRYFPAMESNQRSVRGGGVVDFAFLIFVDEIRYMALVIFCVFITLFILFLISLGVAIFYT